MAGPISPLREPSPLSAYVRMRNEMPHSVWLCK